MQKPISPPVAEPRAKPVSRFVSRSASAPVAMTDAAISTLYADLVTATRATGWAEQATTGDTGQWLRPQWEAQVLMYCLLHERLVGVAEAVQDPNSAPRDFAPREYAQSVFDLMTYDWDQTLRVRGAGDAKTVRLMRHLGQGFYGRMKSYQEAVAQDDATARLSALEEIVLRTLLADCEGTAEAQRTAHQIAQEALALREALSQRDAAEVWAGLCLTAAWQALRGVVPEAEPEVA